MHKPSLLAYAWFAFSAGALVCCTQAADQPQWGHAWTRNQVSSETGLPATFAPETGENIKWIAPLGTRCYATPVIADGRIYIGTNNGAPRMADATPRSGMVRGFGDVAFSLEVGEIGMAKYSVGSSPYGWHIIKRLS